MEQAVENKPSLKNYPSLLIIFYAVSITISISLTNKIVDFDGFYLCGCLIAFPLLYFFGDITAEVFGYKFAKKLIWQILFAGLIFSIIVFFTIKLPSPSFYNNTNDYLNVFGLDIRFVLVGMLAIWISGLVNAYIIARTKVIYSGKYFWVRSILATSIGELVNSLIAFPLAFGGILSMHQILNMVIASYIFKLAYAFIAVYPASLIVRYYKEIKNFDVYDKKIKFNPFD